MDETRARYLKDKRGLYTASEPFLDLFRNSAVPAVDTVNAERAARGEDKLTVNRARKVQRFLSQPFHVAEQFTGYQGKYVPLKETIRSFQEIIAGKYDDIPESYFLFAGSIDDVVAKYRGGEKA